METLSLKEVSAKEWVQLILQGCVGMQSGNNRLTYVLDGDHIKAAHMRIHRHEIDEWLDSLNDGYRTFYIVQREIC